MKYTPEQNKVDAERYRALRGNAFNFTVGVRGENAPSGWAWKHYALEALDEVIDKVVRGEHYKGEKYHESN